MPVGSYGILRALGIKEKRPLPTSKFWIRLTIYCLSGVMQMN